jgi:hypothetical protein
MLKLAAQQSADSNNRRIAIHAEQTIRHHVASAAELN